MFKKVESILVTKQETIVLLIIEPTIVEGVHLVIKVRYNEPKFNH
jgi:hypothetical protein